MFLKVRIWPFNFICGLNTRKAAGLLVLVGLLLYVDSWFNQLFWDDFDSIVNNQYIRSWQYLPKYFSENLTAGAGIRDNYWRPLLLISFSIDYFIGGLTPFWYHLQNTFWHILSAVLVFDLVQRLVYWKEIKGNAEVDEQAALKINGIALVTALIFLVHPLQTEAVTYVAGRADPMYAAMMLGSLVMLVRFMTEREIQSSQGTLGNVCVMDVLRNKNFSGKFIKVDWSAGKYYFYSLGLLVLALLVKERSIVFPGLAGLVILFYGSSVFDKFKQKIIWLMPYVGVVALYLLLRMTVLHFAETFDFGTENNIGAQSIWEKYFTILKGFAIYHWLLIWPAKLYMEKKIAVAHSFFEAEVLAGFVLLCVWLGAAWYFCKKNYLITLGALWFLGTLAFSIHVFPIQGLLYEHWLYVPIIGVALALATGIIELLSKEFIFTKFKNYFLIISNAALLIFVIFIICLSARTLVRNLDWYEPINFYEKNINYGGFSARVYTNLGMAYGDAGRHQEAIASYQKAIELEPDIFQPWYDLGNSYQELGNPMEAERAYQKALVLNPYFLSTYNNLASVYFNQEKYADAAAVLTKALEKFPQSVELLYNLAVIEKTRGNSQAAEQYLKEAKKLQR
jgi:tetratricopeptide (TPR) repeat protein